jgi:hypothetical protein
VGPGNLGVFKELCLIIVSFLVHHRLRHRKSIQMKVIQHLGELAAEICDINRFCNVDKVCTLGLVGAHWGATYISDFLGTPLIAGKVGTVGTQYTAAGIRS